MAIYVKIDGIDGNVTAKGHEKWIEAHSMSFGVGRGITSAKPGNQTNREASIPRFSEISISKSLDETSPRIFNESVLGKGKKVQIHFAKSGENIESFMEYELENAIISSYSISSDSGTSHPSERISLNYDKINMNYKPFTQEHGAGSPVAAGYDLKTGAAAK